MYRKIWRTRKRKGGRKKNVTEWEENENLRRAGGSGWKGEDRKRYKGGGYKGEKKGNNWNRGENQERRK